MPRVNHPFRTGVSKNVSDDIAEKWFENGWTLADEPTAVAQPATKSPAKKTAAKKTTA